MKVFNTQKFPSTLPLRLSWHEAAIAHLLLFNYLKQKHNNCVYFLISEQGILLKATTQTIRDNVRDQIDKFFSAKIEQLQLSKTPQFYQLILKDIQQQTQRLKDTRDCPYINLVYSQKLKNSCLSMKKFGYYKPYEQWQKYERQRKGFCYLIVRPQHRWKQIAANVMSLVRKRQNNLKKDKSSHLFKMQISFEKFIWLYLQPQFEKLKEKINVSEQKNQSTITIEFSNELTEYKQLERAISSLKCKYSTKKPRKMSKQSQKNKNKLALLSSFDLEKITQLIFHQFGLPKLVRQIRRKCTSYLVIGCQLENVVYEEPNNPIQTKEQMIRIDWKDVQHVFKLGKQYTIVAWEGTNYVSVRYQMPFRANIQKMMKARIPAFPKYYAYYLKDSYIYFLRKYYTNKLKGWLQSNKKQIQSQVEMFLSLIEIVRGLHNRKINVGSKFIDSLYIDQQSIIVEPSQTGSNVEDISKLTLLLRQWVKEMKSSELKDSLEKINEPYQMVSILENYLNDFS